MKTSVDVLAALLAVKELEVQIKTERITQLINMYNALYEENSKLLVELNKKENEDHTVGFKKSTK